MCVYRYICENNITWRLVEFARHWMIWQRLLKINCGSRSPLNDVTTPTEGKLWNSLNIEWFVKERLLKVNGGSRPPLNDLTSSIESTLWNSLTFEWFDNVYWR